ncbi:EamA family transporter [Enemella dayhoffiae]|uniref:EamA family transporter n=1 Tax=Enemella dayhoffiae TaxID=2016507 RepID=A0A255GT42_9ACTN|nr:DMT family transporter [Enemella dayhoffiae]OYO18632.1 EamA family transporter [Enemella dayhoffiae]
MTAAPSHPQRREVIATVALILAWAGTMTAIKIGLQYAPPLLFGGLRCLLGGLLMLPLVLRHGVRPRIRENWRPYLLLTLTNVIGFIGLQTLALNALPSGLGGVVIYLQPVLVAILARFWLGEPLGPGKAIGLLVAFGGIVVVSAAAMGGHVSLGGILLAATAAFSWALGTVGFKHSAPRLGAWWSVAVPFLAGGMVLTVAGLAVEGPRVRPAPGFFGAWAFAGVLGTGVAWMLYFWLVAQGEAGRTASRIFFVPILALLIGAVVLGERLSPMLLVGAGLVVVGVYLVNRRRRPAG